MAEPGPVAQLERNAVGLTDVLFQSITSMAPGAAIAASIPLGAAFAGGALPTSVFIAFIGMLFTAVSIGQLAKHIPAAGSVATYNAVGLAPWVGFLVGWAYAAVEVLIVPLVMLQLGYTVAGEWHSESASFPLGSTRPAIDSASRPSKRRCAPRSPASEAQRTLTVNESRRAGGVSVSHGRR